jgi:hypothetical protein
MLTVKWKDVNVLLHFKILEHTEKKTYDFVYLIVVLPSWPLSTYMGSILSILSDDLMKMIVCRSIPTS